MELSKFVHDMKLCDMEDYFLDPSKSSASFIAQKSLRFWKIGSLNFGIEQYGQVFATLMPKVVVINYIGISKNRLSSRVILQTSKTTFIEKHSVNSG